MKSSFRLFRVAGIDIGIHYTWIFIFLLITWSLAQGFFPQVYPGWDTATYWITATSAALLLFVSVLLHELAHSLVAKARGMSVNSITLFIFGGVSNLEEEPEKPRIEFTMAIVGPLTSLALAGIFWVIAMSLTGGTLSFWELISGTRFNSPVQGLIGYLAFINMILGVFNLIPGFPLDGGRVLRSILWGTTGSLRKATNIAATAGRFTGWGLIAFGLFQLLSGNFLGGIWIAFIGWFLSSAADASRRELTLREQLIGIRVSDVFEPLQQTIDPDTTVSQLVWNVFRRYHGRAVPVCRDGKLMGIVSVTDVKELPQEKWADTAVKSIMTSAPLYTVSPEDDLQKAMSTIAKNDINQILVLQQGQCAGLLSRAAIINYLQFNQELGMK